MTDLYLDDDFQPSLKENSDLRVKSEEEEIEQRIRLMLTDRLFDVISEFEEEQAKLKIELEINRIAATSSFIDSVNNVAVTRKSKNTKASYFDVEISFENIDDFSVELDNL